MGLLSSIGGVLGKGVSAVGNFLNKGSGTFSKPLLSIDGQKERLSNVAQALKVFIPGSGVKLQANKNILGSGTVAKVATTIVNHPYMAAGVATGGIMATKRLLPIASAGVKKIFPKAAAGGAIATAGTAAIPKTSGILTTKKENETIPNLPSPVASNPSVSGELTEALIAKKDNNMIMNALTATTARRKTTRKHKKAKKHRRTKRHARRKLKFGSKAFRKKYLNKKRHSKKHKGKSRRGLHYTKKGQPYIIDRRTGKAKFVKKKRR
jgi:hypothetical protein